MKSILFIALACSQVLMAAQRPTYERSRSFRGGVSEPSMQSGAAERPPLGGGELPPSQKEVLQNANCYYETSYSKDSIKSQLQKEKGAPKWIGKTCAVAAVSATVFALCTIQASFGAVSSPYKPFVAAGVAGAATYAYLELNASLESNPVPSGAG